MKRFGLTPLLVAAALAVAALVTAKYAPYFPSDVPIARAIQSWAPAGDWARAVTRAAYEPWVYGVLAVSAIAAFRVAGWRAAAAMAVTFFVFMQVEQNIKELVARPRPSAELVQVAGAPMTMGMTVGTPAPTAGYSMPSGWALLFGSTVGLLSVLAWQNTRGVARTAYTAGCAFILIAGLAARVSLGAHWPSDVVAGYLLSIAVGLGVFELFTSLGPSRTRAARRSSRPTR